MMSSRKARVNRAGDGQPLGLALFITARELRSLGIDPGNVDRVAYTVENGEIRLSKPDQTVLAE
jgi:hypothetical protein